MTVSFFLGFALTYAFFGSIAGLFGSFSEEVLFFNSARLWIQKAQGVVFLLIGFVMLRAIPLPKFMSGMKSIPLPKITMSRWWSAGVVGIIFATGWSPCIGPILGGVLLLAAESGSVLTGTILLVIFSFGLLVPVFILSILYTVAKPHLAFANTLLPYIRFVVGFLFIGIGILAFTGNLDFFGAVGPPVFFEDLF